MAQQTINAGPPYTGAGDLLPVGWQKTNANFSELYALQSKTLNAADPRFAGATNEISINNSINMPTIGAIAVGAQRVYIPASMLPFDASQVNGSQLVRQIREGGSPDVYDLEAYGAAMDGITDDIAAWQDCVDAVPLGGGVVRVPSGISLTSDTIILPEDRLIIFWGDGAFATNQGGLSSIGSVLRRYAGFTTGPLMSQTGGSGSVSKYGVQMRGMGFDGNNLAGDLLSLTNCAQVRLENVVFFNGNGNGLLANNLQNSAIRSCQFFELGNTTAFPNGAASLYLQSSGTNNSNTIFLTDCHWEGGRGSYLLSNDATGGTHPIDVVTVLGGKMEWSGNFALGAAPAQGIGMPFIVTNNASEWIVKGLSCFNGYHSAVKHIVIQNAAKMWFDVYCATQSGQADNQLPTYFVDLISGTNFRVGGTFINGASAGTAGAHIRIVESGVTGYSIDSATQFLNPASGTTLKYTNPTAGKASRLPHSGGAQDKAFALTWGTSIAINANDGNYFTVTATSDVAGVVQIPTNPPPTGQSQRIRVEIFNNSGGPLSTSPTFATGTNGFLVSTVTNPANGTSVIYTFDWSPVRSKWVEFGTHQAAGL